MSIPRHKVFISFYFDEAIKYKLRLQEVLEGYIVDKSTDEGDIPEQTPTDEIIETIRKKFIGDSTVTIVLISPCAWQRKFIDWEIYLSFRDTKNNPRNGVLGILLPEHSDHWKNRNDNKFQHKLIPPRLSDNTGSNNNFVKLYDWPYDNPYDNWSKDNKENLATWIHEAFERRNQPPAPINNRDRFGKNRSGRCIDGWKD